MGIAQRLGAQFKATDNRPPMMPGGLPLAGHMLPFSKDPVEFIHEGRRRYGDAFSMKLVGNTIAVITGPDGNEAVFRAADDHLSPKEAYKLMTPIFGKGIAYDAPNEKIFREQIGFLHPALHRKRLETYAQHMNEETERYVERWGDQGTFDLLDMTNELTMYISSRCLLGEEIRRNLNSEFSKLYIDLEGGLTPLAFFFPYLPLPVFRRRDRARKRTVQLIERIVAERRARGVVGEDMLQTLMEAHYQSDGRALSADEITGLLLTIIFAGHHTSGVLAAWAGIELLQHPQYMPQILAEQAEVYANGREVSMASLKELTHLERAIMEAERLHPPIVIMMRKVVKPFDFNGYTIPVGDFVIVSPAVSNRVESIFKNPHVYDPQRFAPGREEQKQHAYSMTTFGGGKHLCLGLHFAYMQIKALWSVLLRRFELELASQYYPPSYDFMVVGPRHPCLIRYQRRREALVEVPRPLGSAARLH